MVMYWKGSGRKQSWYYLEMSGTMKNLTSPIFEPVTSQIRVKSVSYSVLDDNI
jgi:hypothetical protein